MKKLSLVAIKNALVGFGYEDADILAELDKEITKGDAQKEANAKAYESIVKGDNMPIPGIPESFNVLIHELRGLGLEITFKDKDGKVLN